MNKEQNNKERKKVGTLQDKQNWQYLIHTYPPHKRERRI
jgi:hypothetical protein